MNKFVRKNYDNSFLFGQEINLHHKKMIEFIMKSERIVDKKSDAFRGIVEDVKRYQKSSVLYSILLRDDVVLCMNNIEMPAAFKVFEAKDLLTDKKPKVFIDVSKLIVKENDYYVCRKIDVLITYLLAAATYLLYRINPYKLVNNSNISIAGTECYVAMFDYIIDYLRIIGYSTNKPKISYLAGLFYLHNMMGKDIDNYTKNIAAKVAGLNRSDVNAFDLYYDENTFTNIDAFLTTVINTFNLKGLTTEVFIAKWMYQFGKGSYYGTELFTSFSTVITNAYCGSYVNNQKQIERCCGKSMVRYTTSLIQIATEELDARYYMGEAELASLVRRDKATLDLKESFLSKKKIPEEAKFIASDYESKSKMKSRLSSVKKYYMGSEQEDKLSNICVQAVKKSVIAMNAHISKDQNEYEVGTTELVLKELGKYLNDKDKRNLNGDIKNKIEYYQDNLEKSRLKVDKEKTKKYSEAIKELRKCMQYL